MIRPSVVILAMGLGVLTGCSDDQEGVQQAQVADNTPARGSFEEVLKPKKVQSKPCSKYQLKFYEGDVREFSDDVVRLGDAPSDARIEINKRPVAVLGFEGQAEEYINYSIYRGNRYTNRKESNGAMLATRTETQIIVCFKKDVIAVKQLVERVRSRGDLSKTQYFEKQWLWQVPEG